VDSTDAAVVVELGPLHVDVIVRRYEAGFPKRAKGGLTLGEKAI
jgi:hypothetical protein